ncbi:MAG: SCP2 sterol-binding domain-containing protein [Oscillospiraceae bacterium]|nr:SCP2 sterol-binding domain-containing protein [Oscillospiraceae bacterium]
MTYEEIFAKTKEKVMSAESVDYKGHLAVEIDIVGEGAGAFYIELADGKVSCEPYEYYDHDCKLLISGEDFLAICDGSLDSVKAFTVGKLKVERSIDKALEFSKIVNSLNKAEKAEKKAAAKAEKSAPASKAKTEAKPAAKKTTKKKQG